MTTDNLTPTQKQIVQLEETIATVGETMKTTLGEWQRASEEDRKGIEERLRGFETMQEELRGMVDERRRTTLPGSEPNHKTGEVFSLAKLARGIRDKDKTVAPYEFEVVDAMREKAMSSGTDSAGGFLVPEEAIPQIIDRLRAQVVVFQMGARELPATGAPVTIPRLATSATAAWVSSESATIAASDQVWEQLSMSPKSLASRVVLSNQLLELSTPAADMVIEDDIVRQLSEGLDQAALQGSGASGEPTGITNTSGVSTQTATSPQITWAELIEFPQALAENNALRGRVGWVLNPAQMGALRTIVNPSNVDLERRVLATGMEDTLLGYPWMMTTLLTGTSGLGADSIIFGNWDDLIVCMWGGLRLRANDTGDNAFSKDETHIRGIMRADIGVRQPKSFVVAS